MQKYKTLIDNSRIPQIKSRSNIQFCDELVKYVNVKNRYMVNILLCKSQCNLK